MAINNSYFPADRHARADWYRNMSTQFPAQSTLLGFSQADATDWLADCTAAAFALDGLAAPVTSFAQSVTGYVNTLVNGPADATLSLPAAPDWPPTGLPAAVPPGIDGRRQKTVARIKLSPGYNASVGALLRTEPTGTPPNRATAPGLIRSLHLDAQGRVVAAFSKLGGAIDAVNLYMLRGTDAAPGTKVGTFTHTPALDATPAGDPRRARNAHVHGGQRRQRPGGRGAQPGAEHRGRRRVRPEGKSMHAILDVPEIRARVRRWTVATYRALAEDNAAFRHAELVRGIILDKGTETPLHVSLRHGVAEVLRREARGAWWVRQKASLLLTDSVPEPDVSVVAGVPDDHHDHPTTAGLVVEIAVASLAIDQAKAALYAEAGVAEYWIVLAEAGQVEVYRRPEAGAYRERRTYGRGETIEGVGVTGGAVAVEALFA